MLIIVAVAAALALVSLGGGFYEVAVVDPTWPKRPDLVQPSRGGISRRRFWIAAHVGFEAMLLASLVWPWSQPTAPADRTDDLRGHALCAGGDRPAGLRMPSRSDH